MTDEELMRRALALAEQGRYGVSPNPMVGALIVRDGQVVSEGFHARAGEPHAEVMALRGCSDPRGATMVVTLEPCAHFGRTPPCVDAITDAGIARVVMAMRDPHARAGGGAERLRAHGVEVVSGVLEDEARRLNEKFVHGVTTRRPFVLLKAGMTFDGKLATVDGDSQWITSPAARQVSLKLREEFDAIAVGGNTVLADDPQLTRRLGLNTSVQPWLRVLLDRDGVVPPNARVLTDGQPTLHIANDVDLDELMAALYEKGVTSLIVEGGSALHSQFLRQHLWQKLIVFVAPAIVGGASAPALYGGDPVRRLTDALRFRFDSVEMVGPDVMVVGYPEPSVVDR
jgi:diaminohydroxyphosphoribosylaminopyrimidine deaminase/5-amino-6-(5-phosphoribosylamino)uracil reductase